MIHPYKLEFVGNNSFEARYICPSCGGDNVLLQSTEFPEHDQDCDGCGESLHFNLYRPPESRGRTTRLCRL